MERVVIQILSMIKKLANTNNQVNWKELLNYTNNLSYDYAQRRK